MTAKNIYAKDVLNLSSNHCNICLGAAV